MNRRFVVFALVVALGCRAASGEAPVEPSAQTLASAPASADTPEPDPDPELSVRPGVNDNYTPDKVDWYATRFSRDGREVADRKADILKLLDLAPGQTVADIGSGTGLYTRELSALVGDQGRVYAVDVTEAFLERVRTIVRDEGLANVMLVLADPRDVGLPAGSVDVAFMSNVYHHVEYPITYMGTVRRALAPGGRLFVIDFRREADCDDEWVLEHVRAGEATVLAELQRAGFELVARHEIMTRNYFLELRVVGS